MRTLTPQDLDPRLRPEKHGYVFPMGQFKGMTFWDILHTQRKLLLVDKEGTTRSPYLKEWVAWVDKFFDVDDAGVYLREIPNDDPVEDMPSRKISAKKTPPNPPKPNKCTQCTDSPRGDQLHTPSEKHVSYVAIQKPPEGMKPQSFLQRIALMLLLPRGSS